MSLKICNHKFNFSDKCQPVERRTERQVTNSAGVIDMDTAHRAMLENHSVSDTASVSILRTHFVVLPSVSVFVFICVGCVFSF